MSASRFPARITPVILSGGAGTRLWPVSRAHWPKQLHPLTSERTMLQETAIRTGQSFGFAAPVVVCNDEHRFFVAGQLQDVGIPAAAIVLEPRGRNTAPAATVAAILVEREDADTLLLVLPSDHVIGDTDGFHAAIARGVGPAMDGVIVTFGILPDSPQTGYGYIRAGEPLVGHDGCLAIDRFVEKPDRSTAEGYLAEGGYYWNSGMFLFHARTWLDEMKRLHPESLAACREAIDTGARDLDFFRLGAEAFERARSESIDYGVMEQTRAAAVVPADIGWSDVGSWAALAEISEKDGHGNVVVGDVIAVDTTNSYLRSEHGLLAVVGLENVVIVATRDAILATSRDRTQDVREVVARLEAAGRTEHIAHAVVFRPWGSYQTVDLGERFQVKRIIVNPGARLSLQMHHHRAEHWIVVSGTALVTRGEDSFMLEENQSTYIPLGETHRLENPGKLPLHLIEVQSGSYLGEDDIVRFEDSYGRA